MSLRRALVLSGIRDLRAVESGQTEQCPEPGGLREALAEALDDAWVSEDRFDAATMAAALLPVVEEHVRRAREEAVSLGQRYALLLHDIAALERRLCANASDGTYTGQAALLAALIAVDLRAALEHEEAGR